MKSEPVNLATVPGMGGDEIGGADNAGAASRSASSHPNTSFQAKAKRTKSMYDEDEDPAELKRFNCVFSWVAHSKLLLYTPMLVVYFQLQTILSYSVWALNLRAGDLETSKVSIMLFTAMPMLSGWLRFEGRPFLNQVLTLSYGLFAVLMRVIQPWVVYESRAFTSAFGVGLFWMWLAGHLGNQSFLFNGLRRASKRADDFARSVVMALLLLYVFRASGTSRDISYMAGYSNGDWFWGWLVCIVAAAALLANAITQRYDDRDGREQDEAEEDRNMMGRPDEDGWRSHLTDCVACVDDTCLDTESIFSCAGQPRVLSAAGLVRTVVLCFGVSGILLFLYVNFSSPTNLARWVWVGDNSWGNYRTVLTTLAFMLFFFLLGSYLNLCFQARAIRLRRDYNRRMRRLFYFVLVPLNLLFITLFVLTTQQQQPVPRSFFAPQDEDKPGPRATLYLSLILSPVIFVNLVLLMREVFFAAHRHPKTVAVSLGVANLFYSFLMLLLVFTVADERLPVVDTSARWRDQYTFTVLLLSLFAFLPVLVVRVNLLMTVRFKFGIKASTSENIRLEQTSPVAAAGRNLDQAGASSGYNFELASQRKEEEAEVADNAPYDPRADDGGGQGHDAAVDDGYRTEDDQHDGGGRSQRARAEPESSIRKALPPSFKGLEEGVPEIPYIPPHVAVREGLSAAATVLVALILVITIVVQAGDVTPQNPSAFAATTPRVNGRVRFMTYNIHLGFSRSADPNIDKMADEVRARDADVITLTESDSASLQSGLVDSVLWMANDLGYKYHYYGAQAGKGFFGVAMLSRFPLEETKTYFVPGIEQETIVGWAKVAVPSVWPGSGGVTNTTVYNLFVAHLNTDIAEGGAQMEVLTNFTSGRNLENVVISGDFNFGINSTRLNFTAYNTSTTHYDEAWMRRYPSGFDPEGYPGWTNKQARNRLDMFFISPSLVVHDINAERHEFCGVCSRLEGQGPTSDACFRCSASDHLPVWTDLSIV